MMSEAPSVQNRPRVVGKAAGDAKLKAVQSGGNKFPKIGNDRGVVGRRFRQLSYFPRAFLGGARIFLGAAFW
jgi:hypothetical protein